MGDSLATISYDRDIRPILSDKCFRCHGPDSEARQAGLRLDTRVGLTESAVVPGDPAASELVARILSDDVDERMPPPESRLALSAEERGLLRRWVAEGAVFAEHWAFQELPTSVDVPATADAKWPRETLDRFVLSRLEKLGLQPSERAASWRLLRRVRLDLTGLPPTADEFRKFAESVGSDGFDPTFAKTVDRLLVERAFGEHMAVAWLDAARYADSYGYQSDQLNTQWPYRDWVVRALNANMPYDQFLTWQLAGDLLDNPSRDQRLATAFNRLHRLTNEGGSIAAEALIENAADRVQTLGTAILGLTLECARCHDHKYDPISMRDYYSLTAFFNSIDENGLYDHVAKVPSPTVLLPTPEQEAALKAARERVTVAESALRTAIGQGEPRYQQWLVKPVAAPDADLAGYFAFDGELETLVNKAAPGSGEGKSAGLQSVPGIQGRAVRFNGDQGAIFPGLLNCDRWDCFTLDLWLRDSNRRSLPVVVLQRTFGTDTGYNGFDLMLDDGNLEARLYRVWPGNGIGVRATDRIAAGEWQHVSVTYEGSSAAAGMRLYLNGAKLPTKVVRDQIHKSASLPTYGEGHFTLGQRFRDRGFEGGEIDELRVYARALTPLEVQDRHDNNAIVAALADSSAQRSALRLYYFSAIDEPARECARKLRETRRQLVDVEETLQEVPVMAELPKPRPTFLLARGAYDAPKSDANRVYRDTFAAILMPFPRGAPHDRLGLARWLTNPHHPLTARVFVNRLWANFFGRGLVATPENFGRQGEAPTHPELLDWLARDFVDHGWDIKRLCRSIVLSAAYQQDSRCSPRLRERDPENALLARGPSHRLSAEQIRDVALAASGLIDRRIGGAPVSPYQPGDDLWREANTMSPPYRQSVGRDLHRRSLYSVWKRTAPLPNMLAFDAPTREACTVARGRTNTPLQALVLLNDVQFVEAAQALAAAVSRSHIDLAEQLREAFLRLTGRLPDMAEIDLLRDLYKDQRRLFAQSNGQDAFQFTRLSDSKAEGGVEPAHLAALAVACQAIINLDATIYER